MNDDDNLCLNSLLWFYSSRGINCKLENNHFIPNAENVFDESIDLRYVD